MCISWWNLHQLEYVYRNWSAGWFRWRWRSFTHTLSFLQSMPPFCLGFNSRLRLAFELCVSPICSIRFLHGNSMSMRIIIHTKTYISWFHSIVEDLILLFSVSHLKIIHSMNRLFTFASSISFCGFFIHSANISFKWL